MALFRTCAAGTGVNTISSRNSSIMMIQQQLLLLLLSLWLTALPLSTHAYKDSNVYPWGTNPNTHFKMYWKDASNVLQDLENFQALYVQVHGCVWSECGVDNFDDDGENHDGDENWYQTRTRTFCANAAYSLYGIRKNNFKLVNTCSKGTYINTFFTYGGADTLAHALELSINENKDDSRYHAGDDDAYSTSNSDCVAMDNYGRFLEGDNGGSGSGDSGEDDAIYEEEGDTSNVASTTMGCAASPTSKYNKFVTAGFSDEYCSGHNFVTNVDTLPIYNKAMGKVKCHRIWELRSQYNSNSNNNNNDDANANANNDDLYNDADEDGGENRRDLEEQQQQPHDSDALTDTEEEDEQDERHLSQDNYHYTRVYHSVAEQLLYQSWACDLSLYPIQCPDPYGLKRKYYNVMKAAKNGQPIGFAVWNARLRKPVKILTWLAFIVGSYLTVFAYYIRNRTTIQENGGGVVGFASVIKRDIIAGSVIVGEQVAKLRERHAKSKASKRSGDPNGSSSKSNKNSFWSAIFGKNKKRKKKKKRKHESSSRSGKGIQRSASGRSINRSASGRSIPADPDGEETSNYTELTDEFHSTRSGRSSRHASSRNSANYSSSRTSKAAEAAFAAAAQYDLEKQQKPSRRSSRSNNDPDILPQYYAADGGENRSRSAGRHGGKRRSKSPTSSSSRGRKRSNSNPPIRRSMVDPSPTRSPGGSSIRARSRSRSSERRVFV